MKQPVKLFTRPRAEDRDVYYLKIYQGPNKWKTETLDLYNLRGNDRKTRAANAAARASAERIVAERTAEWWSNKANEPKSGAEAQVRLFDFFDKVASGYEYNTRKGWLTTRLYLGEFEPNEALLLRDVNKAWVHRFRDWLERFGGLAGRRGHNGDPRPLHTATKAGHWGRLRHMFREALSRELIDRDPTEGIKGFSKANGERSYLTKEELRQLAATPAPDNWLRRVFLFSCLTGLRWGDIIELTPEMVSKAGSYTRITFAQQKTGAQEYLDINQQAAELLGDISEVRGKYIFGYGMTNQQANRLLKEWVARAQIRKHITFHAARHTFATVMLDAGIDLYTVSKLLGHTSVKTTQIYAKVIDKNKQRAVDMFPELT